MRKAMEAIGKRMIAEKKAEIHAASESDAKGGVERRDIQGRDLFSLLIKANMATDVSDAARMTDGDMDDALRRDSNFHSCRS